MVELYTCRQCNRRGNTRHEEMCPISLKDDNSRLREALEDIKTVLNGPMHAGQAVVEVRDIANDALVDEPQGKNTAITKPEHVCDVVDSADTRDGWWLVACASLTCDFFRKVATEARAKGVAVEHEATLAVPEE